MSSLNSPLIRALRFLAAQQQADGGWGYMAGKQSFPEPTCYTLLALADTPDHPPRETRALAWLSERQAPSGALTFSEAKADPDNWGTILACFTLRRLQLAPDLSASCLSYLLRARGNRLEPQASRQLNFDGTLRTWSWAPGTASWVEPTAYALIALKAHGLHAHERVKEGEAYLLDRACYDGGWNYGNKEVFGVKLEAMPTVTAYALLALQDCDREQAVIAKSLAYLERELDTRQSALTLALGALCLNVYGRPVANLLAALRARQEGDGSWQGNTHLTALAALALQAAEKKNMFQV
jgi:hypothetical protein